MKVNKWNVKPIILNNYDDEIPLDIAKIAIQRMEKRRNTDCEKNKLKLKNGESVDLISMFLWEGTPEGDNIWNEVYEGNYQPFYDFHNIKQINEMKVNKWNVKPKIINYDEEEIPLDIAKIAIQRMEERPSRHYEKNKLKLKNGEPIDLDVMFIWKDTPEGRDIWAGVYGSMYQPFYDFHNKKSVNEMKVNSPMFRKPKIVVGRSLVKTDFFDVDFAMHLIDFGKYYAILPGGEIRDDNFVLVLIPRKYIKVNSDDQWMLEDYMLNMYTESDYKKMINAIKSGDNVIIAKENNINEMRVNYHKPTILDPKNPKAIENLRRFIKIYSKKYLKL